MMVEQIIYKNDYERQALELLKRQTYAYAKRFSHHDGTSARHEPSLHCSRMRELRRHSRARFASLDHGVSYDSYR